MEGPVGSCRAGVLLIGLVLAGCGGGDDDGDLADLTKTLAEQTAVSQDAQAKSDARNLVTYVEVCFTEQMDYSGCRDAAGGEDVGDATVASAGAATYTIVSPSESGNEFRIGKSRAGAITRACETRGEGGCPANGAW
jgi:type IV pilus assembly protein PilA